MSDSTKKIIMHSIISVALYLVVYIKKPAGAPTPTGKKMRWYVTYHTNTIIPPPT